MSMFDVFEKCKINQKPNSRRKGIAEFQKPRTVSIIQDYSVLG